MSFLRSIAGYRKGIKQWYTNKAGTKYTPFKIKEYQHRYLEHVTRMATERTPRRILDCKPQGRRHLGRRPKHIERSVHIKMEIGTGQWS